jgi:hypothetical protein
MSCRRASKGVGALESSCGQASDGAAVVMVVMSFCQALGTVTGSAIWTENFLWPHWNSALIANTMRALLIVWR